MNTPGHRQPLPDSEAVALARTSATELSRLLKELPDAASAPASRLDEQRISFCRVRRVALLRDLLGRDGSGECRHHRADPR
ncbi:MAG: hypothetical protein U5K99_06280 [Anaerolineales bacterium]|nr:hypothetical protein [Anaerolineales bacterium]